MNAKEIQFEKHWRQAINKEVSEFIMDNMKDMNTDSLYWVTRLQAILVEKSR